MNEFGQGKVDVQGTPADLCQKHNNFVDLIGAIEESAAVESIETFSRRKSETFSMQSTSSSSSVERKDEGVQLEASSKGKVKGSLSMQYFRAGGHWSILLGLGFLFVFVQFVGSAIDYWVSVWSVCEQVSVLRIDLSNEIDYYSSIQDKTGGNAFNATKCTSFIRIDHESMHLHSSHISCRTIGVWINKVMYRCRSCVDKIVKFMRISFDIRIDPLCFVRCAYEFHEIFTMQCSTVSSLQPCVSSTQIRLVGY